MFAGGGNIEYSISLSLIPDGGHHAGDHIVRKILHCDYYWPTIHKDAQDFAKVCDQFQRKGVISKNLEIPMTGELISWDYS